jgi:hypothetical protein
MYRELFYQTLDICKSAGTLSTGSGLKTSCCRWTVPPYRCACRFSRGPNSDAPKGPSSCTCCLIMMGTFPAMPIFPTAKSTMSPWPARCPYRPYSIVAMDKGYNDYSLFAHWTENLIYFVTRLKDNADYALSKIVLSTKPQHLGRPADSLQRLLCPEKMLSYIAPGGGLGQRAKPQNRSFNQSP